MSNRIKGPAIVTCLALVSICGCSIIYCVEGDCEDGHGTYQYDDGAKFTGQWLNGDPVKGIYYFANGNTYEGSFKDIDFHGQGKYTWADGGTYIGNYVHGLRHGQGRMTWPDGLTYVGEFQKDEITGNGTHTYLDGGSFTGEFKDGARHGMGTFLFANGDKYIGQYENDEKHGFGKTIYNDGEVLVSEFRNGVPHGKATHYFNSGSIINYVHDSGEVIERIKVDESNAWFSKDEMTAASEAQNPEAISIRGRVEGKGAGTN